LQKDRTHVSSLVRAEEHQPGRSAPARRPFTGGGGAGEAGENLAGLYSLVATCEVNGVNPVTYLADVLIRVQTHPASRVDELLPHNWKPPAPEPSA
jgi:hypothetical protein